MDKLANMMFAIDETAKDRLLDVKITERADIPIVQEMEDYWQTLTTEKRLGTQYAWLASFAIYLGLDDLELSIKRDGRLRPLLAKNVELVSTDDDSYYKLVQNPSRKELRLFSWYRFPILGMTKLEVGRKAEQSGFGHILEETWFCFNPTPDEMPCGRCIPCKFVKEDGLSRRVPYITLKSRVYHYFFSIVKKLQMRFLYREADLVARTDQH